MKSSNGAFFHKAFFSILEKYLPILDYLRKCIMNNTIKRNIYFSIEQL